jgi:hypothetical protein
MSAMLAVMSAMLVFQFKLLGLAKMASLDIYIIKTN